MPRILLTGTSAQPEYGGPAVSVPRLASGLADLGLETALWFSDHSVPARNVALNPQIRVFSGSLAEAFAEHRPDLVHDNGIWLAHHHAIARMCARRQLPRVVSPRGMLEPWSLSQKGVKKRVAWLGYQRRDLLGAAGLHATSQEEASSVRQLCPGARICIVPNGVDLPPLASRHARTRAEAPRLALFLSRIHPKKGLDLLIEAWSRASPRAWKLLVVGPGEADYLTTLQHSAAQRGLDASTFEMRGPVYGDAKAELFQQASLFILPSFSENFGIAIAEALAHGLPVITTTGTPWRRLEQEGCGWWIAPELPALCVVLAQATSLDTSALDAMGMRGRKLVEKEFGWASAARSMAEAYEAIQAGGGTAP